VKDNPAAPQSNKRRNHKKKKGGGNRKRIVNIQMDCHICENPIRELISAIAYGPEGEPAHFDCVLKKLKEERNLGENEKIQYVGNGSFAIVERKSPTPENPLEIMIKERIIIENKEVKPDWRTGIRDMAIRIENR